MIVIPVSFATYLHLVLIGAGLLTLTLPFLALAAWCEKRKLRRWALRPGPDMRPVRWPLSCYDGSLAADIARETEHHCPRPCGASNDAATVPAACGAIGAPP